MDPYNNNMMNTNNNNNNNKKTYHRINDHINSNHNMVDSDTVLHFFSMDASRESLVKLFGAENVSEERPSYNNKRVISLSNWCFINCLDNKTKNNNIVSNNKVFKNINSLHKFIHKIDKDYEYITNKSKHFSGWSYYKENKNFIDTYFDTSITNKSKFSESQKNTQKTYKLNIETNFSSEKGLFGEIKPQNCKSPILENTTNIVKSAPLCSKNNDNSTYVYINKKIENIDDLLYLIDKYPIRDDIKYNIDMTSLNNIGESLCKLNNMIGLHELKKSIVFQIIYYIQNFHILGNHCNDYMHTVIYGPPGTGKTEIAKIIGKIFSKLGILNNNTFKKVTRADLVAGYLGQTAIKTKHIIQESLGGVLFIDEAYSLGNTEKGDSFSKECIDTLCESLSDHKNDIMVIIAGYKDQLNKCFFSYNEGLQSRFSWRYETNEYSAHELKKIFEKKIKEAKWTITEDIPISWFEKNRKHFKYYGRDMETLFSKTKISHSIRVFCKPSSFKTKLIFDDLINGMELYLKNNYIENEENINTSHMYL